MTSGLNIVDYHPYEQYPGRVITIWNLYGDYLKVAVSLKYFKESFIVFFQFNY